jgi:NDP-sugar pyrophosphorylase family protein
MSKNDKITQGELFEKIPDIVLPLFEGVTYPWEVLPKIKEYILSLVNGGIEGYKALKEGVLIGENVKISPLSVIEPPAIIGEGTEIRPGAYLRGNVIIGKKCVIGNSTEIKNSILFDHVDAPHYNYIGDSILGNGAHMGAGVIASNLKSDKSNVTVRGQRSYETGLRKMGAILGDGAEIGCGTVLNPGTVIGKNTSVYPLSSVRGIIEECSIVKSGNNVIKKD